MTNYLFKLKQSIKHFLFPSTNRLSKQNRLNRRIANFIKDFFQCDETGVYSNFSYLSLQITRVKVKNKKKVMFITIELCRPGLLIGKGGRTIDVITERLEKHFNKKVNIHIVESWLY